MTSEKQFTNDRLEALSDHFEFAYFAPNSTEDTVAGRPGGAIKFSNDWELSVQWGRGNYCDGGVTTAETAIINPNGILIPLPGDYDSVQPWQSWEDVSALACGVSEK